MISLYNSRKAFYKKPFGAVRTGEPVVFTVAAPTEMHCETPYLLLNKDGEKPSLFLMQPCGTRDGCTLFTVTLTLDTAGLYFYFFDLYRDYNKLFCGAGGEAYMTTADGPRWQLTVYEHSYETPNEVKGGVMYQIFPDRFYEGIKEKPMPYAERVYRHDKDGQPYFWPTEWEDGYLNMDYYGGDLAGVYAKLPYLQTLGITIIYFNPIFEAHANHRYNTADYMKVDPLFGSNEEFAFFCKKAKEYGIRVVLDGVFSHTGSDSVYFNREGRYPEAGAWQSEASRWRSWYIFGKEYPCGYRSWWGFDTLPEVNEEDAGYRSFICGEGGVIDTWLGLGASGFRLDVADELPDDFIESIRTAVKRNGADKLLLGEVWEDATTKEAYGVRRTYLLGKGLDSVMNYPFKDAAIAFLRGGRAEDFAAAVMQICEHYPAPALHTLMNFMGTHDTVRAITALAGESCEGKDRAWQSTHCLTAEQYTRGRQLLRMAYAIIFFLPGIPSIYYGDEICMQGYKHPFNRAYFDWNSTETAMRQTLQALAQQRKTCAAFKEGALEILRCDNGILQLERRSADACAVLTVNRTQQPLACTAAGQNVTVPPMDYLLVTQ